MPAAACFSNNSSKPPKVCLYKQLATFALEDYCSFFNLSMMDGSLYVAIFKSNPQILL